MIKVDDIVVLKAECRIEGRGSVGVVLEVHTPAEGTRQEVDFDTYEVLWWDDYTVSFECEHSVRKVCS